MGQQPNKKDKIVNVWLFNFQSYHIFLFSYSMIENKLRMEMWNMPKRQQPNQRTDNRIFFL